MINVFWLLLLGIMLITLVLSGGILNRFFLSSTMIYLGIGYALGPGWLGVIAPNPILNANELAQVAEVALLISLFTVGLKMGSVPLTDRRWLLPLRLAFISMTITVGLIAAVGIWGLGLSVGAAVLLGAILAPTDPVLASGIQTEGGIEPDRLRFSLAGEGGLNDGTAFPFVMLGLGLLGSHGLGAGGLRWWVIDVFWATAGGLIIGAVLGGIIGSLTVYLRTRHQQALGLHEFLSLGLIAMTYSTAQLCHASGFLAVFAAGMALPRVKVRLRVKSSIFDIIPKRGKSPLLDEMLVPHRAGVDMTRAVLTFNEQLEKLAEVGIVMLVGAMLPYISPSIKLYWFIPVFFIVLRSLAVLAGTFHGSISRTQQAMICWFGIRGIGSVFYLMYALTHGVSDTLGHQLITLTLASVATSILLHGASVSPLMKLYLRSGQTP